MKAPNRATDASSKGYACAGKNIQTRLRIKKPCPICGAKPNRRCGIWRDSGFRWEPMKTLHRERK